MGGCESCASSRRKEVASFLQDAMSAGDLAELRTAIKEAEAWGMQTQVARVAYSEIARQDRQCPERIPAMLRWGITTQDGVILSSVIQEAAALDPTHKELETARARLWDHREDAKMRLHRCSRQRDARTLAGALDRARSMGVPQRELAWAEQAVRSP